MKYRKLRIAWSVAWGVACLLLIGLWPSLCRRAGRPIDSGSFVLRVLQEQASFGAETSDRPIVPGLLTSLSAHPGAI
jgi:hypothetical protein